MKIRITDIVANTYYARIHLAKVNDATGQPEPVSRNSFGLRALYCPPCSGPTSADELFPHIPAPAASPKGTEVDVDARPSDAINLAVRFGSPMYVSKRIADAASTVYPDQPAAPNETASEIVRSVRETLASFEDPTGECTASFMTASALRPCVPPVPHCTSCCAGWALSFP